MDYNKIASFDVYYYEGYAKAACIIFEITPFERIISSHYAIESSPRKYIPGKFYERELPSLLKVYKKIKEEIDLIIIDGFVSLAKGEKGLGAHFYYRLNKKIPLIGVAKTLFKGAT
ncbi:MAG TPA: endonuclease V, partial [Syntrophomonadaceae bacterium]|nr:endonuclease V [Syntrophomonadaceae bacterium]